MSFLDDEFTLPSDMEEYRDLECPHCRKIEFSDEDFMNHICEESDIDNLLLIEDIY